MFPPAMRGVRSRSAYRVGWQLGWAMRGFLREFRGSFAGGYAAAAGSPQRSRPGCLAKREPLSLIFVLGIAGIFLVMGPAGWFLNWPTMFAVGILFIALLRGSFRDVPWFLRKLVKLGISLCLLVGFWMLLNWKPLWTLVGPLGFSRNQTGFRLILVAILIWWASVFWIVFSRPKRQLAVVASGTAQASSQQPLLPFEGPRKPSATRQVTARVPDLRFSDVAGYEKEKRQICELVETRLEPAKYKKYGVVRNGILLYGHRGSGKTFLAEATAGEFGLRLYRVVGSELTSMWLGETERRFRETFEDAAAQTPALMFLDEFDSTGSARQVAAGGDPGGAGRAYNSATVQLMEMMTKYRGIPGLVLMAATNQLDGLDEALIREGRFDLKLRVDLPDEATRLKIFAKDLENRPWGCFDLQEFARKTPGASAAKIRSLVDRAASYAAEAGRNIQESDLQRAIEEAGGGDRPQFERVEWDDLVLEDNVRNDLLTLIRLLNDRALADRMQVPVPAGVLLVGPTGTGKTTIARLIATQTSRSLYAIAPADILGRYTGDSVKQVAALFSRAKDHSPSLIFIDEMEGLLPQPSGAFGQHDVQVVDQFLIEISSLAPESNVFLVGATNHPENIDSRALRGGRFSEKIVIGLPGQDGREKLLRKYLAAANLESGLDFGSIAARAGDLSLADLKAVCDAAKRYAFMRARKDQAPPPISWSDFEQAIQRVRGSACLL